MLALILTTYAIFALIVLVCVTSVFLLATMLRDNSIMDIAYGPTFAIASWGTIAATGAWRDAPLIIALCISIWAVRLSLRILRKNWRKPEDARYARWRASWSGRGELYFILRSYIQINLLQGVIISVVALPLIVAASSAVALNPLFALIGVSVFFFGLGYETIADWQLDRFIARKRSGEEHAPLMVRGLFRLSRRPNYFGESVLWWGLAIIALPLPSGWLALLGPLLITIIVTRVTGPMLERAFLEREGEAYRAYMDRTSYFIPWMPKRDRTQT